MSIYGTTEATCLEKCLIFELPLSIMHAYQHCNKSENLHATLHFTISVRFTGISSNHKKGLRPFVFLHNLASVDASKCLFPGLAVP